MKIFLVLCVKFLLRVVSLRSRQRTCKVVAILERSLDKVVLVQDSSAVRNSELWDLRYGQLSVRWLPSGQY